MCITKCATRIKDSPFPLATLTNKSFQASTTEGPHRIFSWSLKVPKLASNWPWKRHCGTRVFKDRISSPETTSWCLWSIQFCFLPAMSENAGFLTYAKATPLEPVQTSALNSGRHLPPKSNGRATIIWTTQQPQMGQLTKPYLKHWARMSPLKGSKKWRSK